MQTLAGAFVFAVLGFVVGGVTGQEIHRKQEPLRLAKEQIDELENQLTWLEMQASREKSQASSEESALLRERLAYLKSQFELDRAGTFFRGNTKSLSGIFGLLGALVGGVCGACLLPYLCEQLGIEEVTDTDIEKQAKFVADWLPVVCLVLFFAMLIMWFTAMQQT